MTRILDVFFMILLITRGTTSLDIFGIELHDIIIVYNYVNQFYHKTEELRESPTLHGQNQAVALHDIMRNLKEVSKEINRIQINEDVKLDTIVKLLLDNIEVSGDLRAAKSELLQHIEHVGYFYNKSMVYDMSGSFSPETLKHFSRVVLSSSNSLLETVHKIHLLIFPGSNSFIRSSYQTLALSYAVANYDRFCDRGISEQQRIFYVFMMIIQSHLKSFTAVTAAYSIQFTYERVQYPHEYRLVLFEFHEKLTEYLKEFVRVIRYFPRDIRRCDHSQPKIGIDVLEFEGLFQVLVNTESRIRQKLQILTPLLNKAQGSCKDIVSRQREQFVVYNCETIDSISGCPVVNSNGIRRFSWWKTASDTYGHPYECPRNLIEVVGSNAGWVYNDVCVCSLNYTTAPLYLYRSDKYNIKFEKPKIMRISVEPQMSDIANNMVVVGVRFIIHDSSIHLQIRQNKLWNGFIPTDGGWKPVNRDNNNKTIPIHYSKLHDRRNIMYLDDVGVDPKYVVTGVRFQVNKEGNGFELHVHGTEYIHETSRLGTSQMWYKPGDYPINPLDYQRKRTEIHLNDPDDPTMIRDYHPDPGANKFVQFQHSSVRKDGGYHTVPFFDAQPATVTLPPPLGGIGLFYRGRDGFGGYIAPRLFTFDLTKTLESSIKKWVVVDRVFRHCHGDELDPTEFETSVDCAKLGINSQGIRKYVKSPFKVDSQNSRLHQFTAIISRDMANDNAAGIRPGQTGGAHVTTTERPSSTGDTSTVEESPRMTTDLSNSIATAQPTGDHSITKPLSLVGDISTIAGCSRGPSDGASLIPVTHTNSYAASCVAEIECGMNDEQRKWKNKRHLEELFQYESTTLYSCMSYF